jgi:hypothetical protein
MKINNKFLKLSALGLGAALLVGCSDDTTKEGKEDVQTKSELSIETVSRQEISDLKNLRNGLLDFVWDYNRYNHYNFDNQTVLENVQLSTDEERVYEIKQIYRELNNLNLIDDESLQKYQASLKTTAIALNEKKLELIELEPKVFKNGGYGLMLKAEPEESDLARYKELLNEIIKLVDAEKNSILRLEIAINNDIDVTEKDVTEFIEYKNLIPAQLKDTYSLYAEDLHGLIIKPALTPEDYAKLLRYTNEVKAILEKHLDNKYAKKEYEYINQFKTLEEYENILASVKNDLNEETFATSYATFLAIHNYLNLKYSFVLGDLDLTTYYEADNYERFYSLDLF